MSLNPGLVARWLFYKATRETTTAFTYRKYLPAAQGKGGVETSGSATTVTDNASLTTPAFYPVNQYDLIQFNYGGTKYIRKVASKTSDGEIEVDTAIDLSNGTSAWRFFPQRSGVTDADGWVYVGQDTNRTIVIDITSLAELVNGILIQVEGKIGHGLANAPLAIYPTHGAGQQFTAPGQTLIAVNDDIEFIRVGVKAHTSIVTDPDVFDIYLSKRAVR